MKELTVYFDYICPYCYRGVMDLMDLLPEFPDIHVNWVPCEAHPRPERMSIYSDTASQAMLSVQEQGGDVMKFHKLVFEAYFINHQRIDDPVLLTRLSGQCGVNRAKVLVDLSDNRYAKEVLANNELVWGEKAFFAVPDYEAADASLNSIEDVMISKEELRKFLEKIV